MKKYIISALVLFILSSANVFANNNSFPVEKVANNYLHLMDSEMSTVVESAVFNVMALKQRYPESDYSTVISKLANLSLRSDKPSVKYKAFLALNYFNHMEWYGEYQFIGQENQNSVFDDIARKMDIRNKINFINRN